MPYIYESDISKTQKNIQTTVAQLVSLHKAEYEWNMLGIKVVGHIDALPIPESEYDYGDAYMVGTETPYDMYIYTRADAYHAVAYWFNVGKFPAPGPEGHRGPGVDNFTQEQEVPNGVIYDTTHGMQIYGNKTYRYTENGETKLHMDEYRSDVPLKPGKYISMDATSDNQFVEVKVDDTALSLDYFKIKKSNEGRIPIWNGTAVGTLGYSASSAGQYIAYRDSDGNCAFNGIKCNQIKDLSGGSSVNQYALFYTCSQSQYIVPKTSTDTGTITAGALALIKSYKAITIAYDGKLYYRQFQQDKEGDHMDFIHLDCVQDGNGGYRCTGKCFSITIATRAWQVVDLNFQPKVNQFGISLYTTGTNILFTLQTTAGVNDIDPVWLHSNLKPTQGTITDSTGTTGCIVSPGQKFIDDIPMDVIYADLPDGTSKSFAINQLSTSIYK